MSTNTLATAKPKRNLLLTLFGLIFLLAGIGFLVLSIAPIIVDASRMQSWPSVKGQVISAKLIENRSYNSSTNEVVASYRYRVNGVDYQNNRVGLSSGADNIGRFHQQRAYELETLMRKQAPVTIYYNPENPQDSILDRDIRWQLVGFMAIFVLVFTLLGAGMLVWSGHRKKRIDSPQADSKPWLARPEWQGGVIRSKARMGMFAIWIFSIVWLLLTSPVLFEFDSLFAKEGNIALLILLFPLIGLAMVAYAIKMTLSWKRFGHTPLTLDPFPGSIGGDVGGQIQVNIRHQPNMKCRVTLSNLQSYVSGSGKNRSRKESLKWQDEGYAKIIPRGSNSLTLQFRFEVPEGLNESEEPATSYHLWRVRIELETDGPNLDRQFEIPVYHTREQSRDIRVNSTTDRPPGVAADSAQTLLPLSRDGNQQIIDYPMLRRPMLSLGLLVFGSVFGGAGLFMWMLAAKEGASLYFMSSVFQLVGWAIVAVAIYMAINALRVTFDGQTLTSTRSVFGYALKTKRVDYTAIRAIESRRGAQTQTGNRHTVEFSIHAVTPAGKIILAENLRSASAVKMVETFFRKEFGLHTEAQHSEVELDLS